jgi:hypothetical protein
VLQPIQAEVDALMVQVHALCQRMTMLENYRLVREARSDLQTELEQLDDAIAKAGDPVVKKEYEDSRRALLEQSAKLKLVSTDLDRVEAQLMSVANAMDGLVIEVVRLQAMEPEEVGRRAAIMVQELRQQADELKQSEHGATAF